ncbi:MAG: L-threonylcarbamoyladenylate synthase [Elusimicrobiota bacterium]
MQSNTKVFSCKGRLSGQDLSDAVRRFLNGEIGIVPTDTIYGLAGRINDERALKRLYDIKKRPESKLFVLQTADIESALGLILNPDDKIKKLVSAFWPGALTIIARPSAYLMKTFNWTSETIALRVPDHPIMRAILKKIKTPLLVTSANISGKEVLTDIEKLKELFNGLVDFVIDDQKKYSSVPSTIVDAAGDGIKIIREGVISKEEINKCLTRV